MPRYGESGAVCRDALHGKIDGQRLIVPIKNSTAPRRNGDPLRVGADGENSVVIVLPQLNLHEASGNDGKQETEKRENHRGAAATESQR